MEGIQQSVGKIELRQSEKECNYIFLMEIQFSTLSWSYGVRKNAQCNNKANKCVVKYISNGLLTSIEVKEENIL